VGRGAAKLEPKVITIDGPSRAGKSSVARRVAARLGWVHLESGLAYRALAWAVLQAGIDPGDREGVERLAAGCRVVLEPGRVLLNGAAVPVARLRSRRVEEAALAVASIPRVRRALLPVFRRAIRSAGGVVLDGRDAGTAIWPAAQLKVFLTAPLEERASRMLGRRGRWSWAARNAALAELERRDKLEERRKAGRLRPARGSLVLDTGGRSAEAVAEEVLRIWRERSGAEGEADP
jgi:cytidylate kinase